ncbi:MAG: hypothetical protein CL468_00460 [Acidimicrobiaceae bacterium]|mgnify:CR=1 FL=1|nr:hypothetical protein [Acidimicrobiaceae bacterium]
MIARRVFAVLVAVLVVTAGCGDEVPVVEPEPVVTTTTRAPGPEVKTNGWVQVGDQTFDLFFTCYSPGAGDVAAIGVGEEASSSQNVEVLIQGFLGQPYVGVTVGESILYESMLEGSLEVFVHDGTISAGAIEWTRGLDLESGRGERVGYGAVFVSCAEYIHDLPEGY